MFKILKTINIIIIISYLAACQYMPVMIKPDIPDVYYYKGHTYFFIRKTVTWHIANQLCKDAGSYLLAVDDQKENEFIRLQLNFDTWIGLTDRGEETKWLWTDGTNLSYSDWYEREPNNLHEQEHYAHYMKIMNYQWNDNSNDKRFHFICEFNEIIKEETRLKDIQTSLNNCNENDPFPFTTEQLMADFAYIVKAVKDVHCSTIDGLSSEQKAAMARIQDKIPYTDNYLDYFDLLNQFFLAIPDPETKLKLTNPIAQYQFPCYWSDEGIFLSKNIYRFIKGDKLISINGFSVDQLKNIVRQNFKQYSYERFNENLTEIFNDFILNKIILPQQQNLTFTIERGSGQSKTMELVLPLSELKHIIREEKQEPAYFYLAKNNSYAVFCLNYMTANKKYRALLADFFQSVYENKIKNIVIDLRKTKGGHSVATDYMLKYLAVDKINQCETWRRFSRELKTRWGWGHGFGMDVIMNKNRTVKHDDIRQNHIFSGKIFVFISRATGGGNEMATVLKDNNIGTFIGESTLRPGQFYGDNIHFKTPFTGLEFIITYKKYLRPDKTKTEQTGIKPDIAVPMTISNYLNCKTPYLNFLERELRHEK